MVTDDASLPCMVQPLSMSLSSTKEDTGCSSEISAQKGYTLAIIVFPYQKNQKFYDSYNDISHYITYNDILRFDPT